MATLVLTAAGAMAGGPVGRAIGALIGNRIDGALLGSGREGPRLGDLTVQTSAYGSAIPKIFGRMRVAGTVIWSTDLIESRIRGGGGKGRSRTTEYSYSASFAVALSARRIRSIGRIWADGMLLRGAAGDWKTATGFRFHDGSEEQAVDPLIAAIEGAGAPAYRGIAYVLFDTMQLGAYGNRIPSLSFEVEADAEPVTVGAIAAQLSDGIVADATATAVGGYAASGDSVRGAIEVLAEAIPLTLTETAEGLALGEGATAAIVFPVDELGTATGSKGGVRREQTRRAAGTVPDEVSLTYHDVARDDQAGLQRARRDGPGRRVAQLQLPASLSADVAKSVAERRLAADWAARRTAVIRLPWRRMTVAPGQAVSLPDLPDGWQVARATLDRMVVELHLVGVDAVEAAPVAAVPGRVLAQNDRPHGPTRLALFELPSDGTGAEGGIRVHIAAAGVSPDWRQAMLESSRDGGAMLDMIGRTAPAATMGRVPIATPPAGSMIFDDATQIEVTLLHDAMMLTGCPDTALLAGENLALIGGELIQFGRAEQIGVDWFRIGRLLRGRRGTEAAIAAHGPDEPFILIDPGRMAGVTVSAAAAGSTMMVLASGIGDPAPVVERHRIDGLALRPPAPVHLTAVREGDGAIRIRWIRRSRLGWQWTDGVDAPLGEETERYRLIIARGAGGVRTLDVATPEWRYPLAQQLEDGNAATGRIDVRVAQVGMAATSLPAGAVVKL